MQVGSFKVLQLPSWANHSASITWRVCNPNQNDPTPTTRNQQHVTNNKEAPHITRLITFKGQLSCMFVSAAEARPIGRALPLQVQNMSMVLAVALS